MSHNEMNTNDKLEYCAEVKTQKQSLTEQR